MNQQRSEATTRIVLVGGGHAHVQVLLGLCNKLTATDSCSITLISDNVFAYYSGMLPGCVAGLYQENEIRMDLGALCKWSKCTFIEGKFVGLDTTNKTLTVKIHKNTQAKEKQNDSVSNNNTEKATGDCIETTESVVLVSYDILSINIGSQTLGTDNIPGVREIALVTRPISQLIPKLKEHEALLLKKFSSSSVSPSTQTTNINNSSISTSNVKSTIAIVVVGAGAAGIELAFGVRTRFVNLFGGSASSMQVEVTVVNSNDRPVHDQSESVSATVLNVLKDHNIIIKNNVRVTQVMVKTPTKPQTTSTSNSSVTSDTSTPTTDVEGEKVCILSDGTEITFHLLLWATGAEPHTMLKQLPLEKDSKGFIRVSKTLQSFSDAMIFAVGDCCSIEGCPWVTKAGVFAVREGPILEQNIINLIRKKQLQTYEPQKGFLSLMMTGNSKAIGTWKGFTMYDGWMWYLKDSIDRAFMNRFNTQKLGNSTAKCNFMATDL